VGCVVSFIHTARATKRAFVSELQSKKQRLLEERDNLKTKLKESEEKILQRQTHIKQLNTEILSSGIASLKFLHLSPFNSNSRLIATSFLFSTSVERCTSELQQQFLNSLYQSRFLLACDMNVRHFCAILAEYVEQLNEKISNSTTITTPSTTGIVAAAAAAAATPTIIMSSLSNSCDTILSSLNNSALSSSIQSGDSFFDSLYAFESSHVVN
jgi:hypothetical protein